MMYNFILIPLTTTECGVHIGVYTDRWSVGTEAITNSNVVSVLGQWYGGEHQCTNLYMHIAIE